MKKKYDIEKLSDKELEEIKKGSAPKDGTPLFKKVLDTKKPIEKQKLKHAISDAFRDSGNMMMRRAFHDGFIKPERFVELRDKYGLDVKDFAAILQAHYNKVDGHVPKEQEIRLLSDDWSPIMQNKDLIEKEFNLKVVSIQEYVMSIIDSKEPEARAFVKEFCKREKINEQELRKRILEDGGKNGKVQNR